MILRDLLDNFYHRTKKSDVPVSSFFLSFFLFLKEWFCFRNTKVKFLNVVDLSFDVRFEKYYQFSSHYHKHGMINIIKVKCLQIDQNFNMFFTDSHWKFEGIADFIILVMWLRLLTTTASFTNEWELINLYTL